MSALKELRDVEFLSPFELIKVHRKIHYFYGEGKLGGRSQMESGHSKLVSKMKLEGVPHYVVDELDVTLPEILQTVHVPVYYSQMSSLTTGFIQDFAGVVDNIVGNRVLNVGCGIGLSVGILKNSGFDACGVDSSPSAVYYGKRRDLEVQLGKAEYLPFSSGSFDTVFSVHLLEHVEKFGHVFKECSRVARKRTVHVVALRGKGGAIHVWPYAANLLLDLQAFSEGSIVKELPGGSVLIVSDV